MDLANKVFKSYLVMFGLGILAGKCLNFRTILTDNGITVGLVLLFLIFFVVLNWFLLKWSIGPVERLFGCLKNMAKKKNIVFRKMLIEPEDSSDIRGIVQIIDELLGRIWKAKKEFVKEKQKPVIAKQQKKGREGSGSEEQKKGIISTLNKIGSDVSSLKEQMTGQASATEAIKEEVARLNKRIEKGSKVLEEKGKDGKEKDKIRGEKTEKVLTTAAATIVSDKKVSTLKMEFPSDKKGGNDPVKSHHGANRGGESLLAELRKGLKRFDKSVDGWLFDVSGKEIDTGVYGTVRFQGARA